MIAEPRKRSKTQALWARLKALGYYDAARDLQLRRQYYAPLFEVLSGPERAFVLGEAGRGGLARRKEVYACLAALRKAGFKHARRRPILFDWVDRRPDGALRCLYTDRLLEAGPADWAPPGGRPKFDEEHVFPQSFQAGTGLGTGRDLHQIFAVSKAANGKRGNRLFGEGPDARRQSEFGLFSKRGGRKCYVPAANAGAAARAFLYVMQGYPGCVSSERFPKGSEEWAVRAAGAGEAGAWERHRNFCVHLLQGTRNPFVDFPRLAALTDFGGAWRS